MSANEQGCRNGNCWLRIGPAIGQHTNGRCNCLMGLPLAQRIAAERKIQYQQQEIASLTADLAEAKAEIERLRAALKLTDEYIRDIKPAD